MFKNLVSSDFVLHQEATRNIIIKHACESTMNEHLMV